MEQKVPTKPTTSSTLPTAQQQVFMATLISLTWQLAIVILVPIIGGYLLDQAGHHAPRWIYVGLGLALVLAAGCLYVGYRTVTRAAKEESNA